MIQGLYSIEEVSRLIGEGKFLLLAGDETLLTKLPPGNWIAGTTPYFMTSNREMIISQEHVFVSRLSGFITGATIREYDETGIRNIYLDAPVNGFTMLIVPNSSRVLFEYALNAPNYPKFACTPVCGWVAGWLIKETLTGNSYSVSGLNPVLLNNRAVAMHVSLPADKYAEINMFSSFKAQSGPSIMFDDDGWVQENATIDGVRQNFAEYIRKNRIETDYPLISNYAGAPVCVSYLKTEGNKVYTYAPLFKGVEYHFSEANRQAPGLVLSGGDIIYSMSCIRNFQRPELCGTYIEKMNGPVTFGEIAYQLVNQTTVYLTVGEL
ncbi:MAG: hypothetical protein LBL04_18320 [Bacteroidales bacterium]|jgi:hypothetical protein|nr:hypothetical protein [Bacteroidales bacterium]